ncbi:type II toxin-antitoxin system prevent-host-death family antitoxin [Rubrobacter tropicus]|uniref:type II toxin-antitoxin system prevent-host-death family antitoxin n=1 Tax=Rubrobacter tropicus TaxID=2653851 RepID=UPI00140775F6|nr:type II toxin-antitoxin system prevent-host-death family antitoxin [Rubrobacter tropicus]
MKHEMTRLDGTMWTARFMWNERCFVLTNNRIPLETLRRSLGQVAQDVERGGSVVVERRGEEVFALVPIRLYRYLEGERRALVESTREAREAFSDLSGDEVEGLVGAEMEAARDRTPPTKSADDR